MYGPGPSPAELVELAGRVDAVLAADRAPAGSATWVQHDGYIEYEVNSAAISIGEGRIVAVHCFGTSHDLDAGGRAALRDLALVLADPRVQVWLHQGAATERYEPWKDIFDWADGRK